MGSKAASLPADVSRFVEDAGRLGVLRGLRAVDTAGDPDFDRIGGLAAAILETPVALVTLVDTDRHWFKSRLGFDERQTPTAISFCAHAIAAGDDPMVVTDATLDPRFAGNPLVTGREHIRFYAGAPVIVAGVRVGTLCVLDRKPRAFPADEKTAQLKTLAELAAS
ncbi:MAG: GAF domain-containing protein, partial [Mesorhizobium sp.]